MAGKHPSNSAQSVECHTAGQNGADSHTTTSAQMSEEEKAGARIRRRNTILSAVFLIGFIAAFIWAAKTDHLASTDQIRSWIAQAGPWGPLLYIPFCVFTSYIPIVPFGSMGSIGIVLIGVWPAFLYNSIVSILNCLLAYYLARRFGMKILLWFADRKTIEKNMNRMKSSKHLELLFFGVMLLPVSPDLLWCMLAGLLNMNFVHFLIMVIISRPISSFAYTNGLLKVIEWLLKALHFSL